MRLEAREVKGKLPSGEDVTITIQMPVREKDKVVIVGCAGSKIDVPWGDETAEYWGVNNLYGVPLKGAHYDRWFEIHNIWYDEKTKKLLRRDLPDFRGQPVDEYMKGLANLNTTIYMQQYWPDLIPMSVPYPIAELLKYFGVEKNLGEVMPRYLTNSISYEIALAIMEGFKTIDVWGVDMSVGTEWGSQRPSCEFWLGIAAGMGINIYVPPQADLLKTRFLYGFEEKKQDIWRIKTHAIKQEMANKQAALGNELAAKKEAFQQYTGAIHAMNELEKIWSNLQDVV
jgi:hypothetical protein